MAIKKLKDIKFPDLPDTYYVPDVDDTLTQEGAAADAKAVGDALDLKVDESELETAIEDLDERKAEIDGCYEGLTSGMAMGLVTDSVVEDKEPYNYRSLANLNVGRFCEDTLVGGSVVWNQIARNNVAGSTSNGITMTNNGDGSYTLNGTAEGGSARFREIVLSTVADHVVFVQPVTSDANVRMWKIGHNYGYVTNAGAIHKFTSNNSYDFIVSEGVTLNNVKVYPQCIDLTAAVTPTIADYIYTLETANAGDGVAWFKKYFPGIYYGYAEPHFEHVQTSAKETVGFNQWDEEWESGYFDLNTGQPVANTSISRSKNFIDALPNTVYYYHNGNEKNHTLLYYDSEKNYISHTLAGATSHEFTTPANTRYMKFGFVGTTYNHDICINLHGDRDGEYEAYRKRTYPVEPKVLRGVPKLDSANRLYFDGDVYQHDGSGETRYKEMTLNGSENWTLFTGIGVNQFYINQSDARNVAGQICMLCDKYTTVNISDRGNGYGVGYTGAGTICFNIDPTQYADVASWKAYLTAHPITVVYLCTPEPFTAEPFQSPMVVDPLGTEEFVDYGVEEGDRDVAIPVGHDSTYPEDLVKKTEKLPSPTGTNGDYVITEVDGKLYLKPYVPSVGLTMTAPTTEGEGE